MVARDQRRDGAGGSSRATRWRAVAQAGRLAMSAAKGNVAARA